MAKFVDICPACGRKYENYDEGFKPWCSVYCQYNEGPYEPEGDTDVKSKEEIKNEPLSMKDGCGYQPRRDL